MRRAEASVRPTDGQSAAGEQTVPMDRGMECEKRLLDTAMLGLYGKWHRRETSRHIQGNPKLQPHQRDELGDKVVR